MEGLDPRLRTCSCALNPDKRRLSCLLRTVDDFRGAEERGKVNSCKATSV